MGGASKLAAGGAVAAAWVAFLTQAKLSPQQVTQLTALLAATAAAAALVLRGKPPRAKFGPAVAIAQDVRRAYPAFDLQKPKESFAAVNALLIQESCAELALYECAPAEVAWVRRMLNYNVEGGKMNRGLMVIDAGVQLFGSVGRPVGEDDLTRFAVLGWSIEWLQAWLLVADDFMDSSVTRRGQPCWYKVPDVKQIAINDAYLIEMLMFKMIKRHFGDSPEYLPLVDLMLETTLQTELGQLLDLRCEHVGLEDFTVDRWTSIVKYKTAYYSFYLPVAMAMILSGITDRSEYDAAREILIIMGIYFQAQDDYLDAFGTPEQIGKIGTDIQDKKCGWLFVNAYHRLVDPKQKAYLEKHYGKCAVGSAEEKAIKQMYVDVNLTKLYLEYEAASYAKIMSLRHTVKQVPWGVFESFLNKIYKRQK
ncbi:isoprenoid synthase domain-containing protein [Pelagophyceae sp. CCMP2097]|nr:isoprenoid synthase domain-containing protein [Pelagophyceae sp. CCMP2097]